MSFRLRPACRLSAIPLLLLSAGPLAAQSAGGEALDRLITAGDWVQVTTPGTIIESARVQRVTADSLFVVDGGQEWFLSSSRIEALLVQQRRTKKYATGGVIGGVLFGLITQAFLNPIICNEPGGCKDNFVTGAVVGGVVFGIGVGIMGHHELRWAPLIP